MILAGSVALESIGFKTVALNGEDIQSDGKTFKPRFSRTCDHDRQPSASGLRYLEERVRKPLVLARASLPDFG